MMPLLRKSIVFAGCASAMLFPGVASAQARAEGPLVLRLPSSARVGAMGNAGVASNDGDALLYNPGMLSASRGMATSVQSYGSNAVAGAFGSVVSSGNTTVGIGATFLRWNAPPGMTYEEMLRQGGSALSDEGTLPSASAAFVLGMARTIKGFRLGANVKYVEERVGASADGALAGDIGVTMPLGPASLGAVVQNIGTGVKPGAERGVLPTRFAVGLGTGMVPMFEYFDLGALMQLSVERDGFVRPAGGVELGYVPIEGVAIVARTGVRLPREPDEPLITAGLGFNLDRFSLDYAMEPMRGGRPVSHRIGIRMR